MKRFTWLARFTLAVLTTLMLAGCKQTPDHAANNESIPQTTNDATLISGVFTGSAQGHNGELTLDLTLKDGVIDSVLITNHSESPNISDLALSQIPQKIVDYQTIQLDTVSGATVTSNAILNAAKDALSQTPIDIAMFSIAPDLTLFQDADIEKTADVIIIGAGGAGLAAAVSAHQNGASVIILEKMPAVGGNTLISGSAYNAVDPSRQIPMQIEDSVELHYQQTLAGGDNKGNPELVKILVENSYPALEWLESLGMEFNDEVFTVLGGLWPRAHKPVKPLGTGYIDTYMDYIKKNNIEVLLNTTATSLSVSDGTVDGVIATGETGNTITLKSNSGVIIATGGFGANSDLREKYNVNWPTLSEIKTTNHAGATGDGLILAEQIGASLIHLEDIQLLPMGDPHTGSLSGNIEQNVENRIFINKDGNRFVAEDARRDVMTKALLQQEDALMWVILDQHAYPNGDVKNNFNESINELVTAKRAFQANTLEELAAQINVNPENLVLAVSQFNEAVDSGSDSFGRTLYQDKINTPPFYAGARVPTVHHTMGGIEINENAQVLDQTGTVIRGLYAAGEVTGGIHGTNRLGGNALADITVFGKIAGESAALKK